MAKMQTLISGPGPLPLTVPFQTAGDGNVVFFISGSAWSQAAGPLSISLYLDGQKIGSALGFTNEGVSHKTLVPAFFPSTVTYGQHKIVLQVDGSTVTDLNDNFNVTLIY
ncbi:MAG TPA: hypothetical protein VGO50_01045 [Pyrinomonadaceae bacterium]|jgi:hypothetical protein|nr:hypothetical protein [Pyrinomonadaceae bacterium]